MTERRRRRAASADERMVLTLDDDTVVRLRLAAAQRGLDVQQLVLQLLVAASHRIDELLPDEAG